MSLDGFSLSELGNAKQAIDRLANTYRAMVYASDVLTKVIASVGDIESLASRSEALRRDVAGLQAQLEESQRRIGEAEARAESIVAEAEERAGAIIAESGETASRLHETAKRDAESIVAQAKEFAESERRAASAQVAEKQRVVGELEAAARKAEERRSLALAELARVEEKLSAVRNALGNLENV